MYDDQTFMLDEVELDRLACEVSYANYPTCESLRRAMEIPSLHSFDLPAAVSARPAPPAAAPPRPALPS
eukprot:tig00020806_g14048.t1